MKVLINYADCNFKTSQQLNSKTGLEVGGFDRVISYGPKDIDPLFRRKNRKILAEKRGAGYWLWKPYIINKTLNSMKEKDWLFYADTDSYFINTVDYLIQTAQEFALDMLVFEVPYLEQVYTKRDAFLLMNCDKPEYTDTRQRESGFILMRRSQLTLDFVKEWQYYCLDERIVTDIPNTMGIPNYPEFIENRHDQSVLSLLLAISQLRDENEEGKYPASTYPQIVVLYKKT